VRPRRHLTLLASDGVASKRRKFGHTTGLRKSSKAASKMLRASTDGKIRKISNPARLAFVSLERLPDGWPFGRVPRRSAGNDAPDLKSTSVLPFGVLSRWCIT
jgi:hypothetical protein